MGSLKTTRTKIENLGISIVIFMDIWQRISGNRRRPESAISAIKCDTLQKIVG